jgi:hypothetical protein
MNTDFKRRVERNTVLKYQNALSPLFEAVMNAIDAIGERDRNSGKIVIEVERDDSQPGFFQDDQPVRSFRVKDNGVGVTEAHFEAFETADTAFRADQGGKGIGRFVWLKAFDHAEVRSTFVGLDGVRHVRTFNLCLTEQGIEDHKIETSGNDSPLGTEIYLCNYKEEYQKEVPKSAETIGRRIIECFLQYFVLGGMPSIVISDTGQVYDLHALFSDEVSGDTQSNSSFVAAGKVFRIAHFLVRPSFQPNHRVYFCSDNKMVVSKPLTGKIPNLVGAVRDGDKSLMYAGYISGEYLDACSNSERTSFHMEDDDRAFGPGWNTLVDSAISESSVFLEPYTEPIKRAKGDRIREFTQRTAPQWRPVVKHRPDLIDTIPPSVGDDKLDQELYRVNQIYESDLRDHGSRLLDSLQSGPSDWDTFKDQYRQFLEEWNESGIAKLAKHVVHRKATIDFFKVGLRKIPESGTYHLESVIHGLIFPLHSTSDDLRPDQMNLWMIDEKLSYHYYLASNLPFSQQEAVSIKSQKKPDAIIYNNPSMLVNDDQPFSSVTILEFKRPLRNDFTDEDNPITQVYEYAEKLKSGKAIDRHGRPIQIREHTPIYAYILCDPTPTLTTQARFGHLKPTPDGLGYVGYNSEVGVWVEIITFEKVVSDAEKRNATLFDQLNIPRQ